MVSLQASTKNRRPAAGNVENCHKNLLSLNGGELAPSLNFNLYPLGVVG
jgi:hypothetical protein